MNSAIRNIERADASVIQGLAKAGVATVHEAQGRLCLMNRDMKPAWHAPAIAGSAVSVLVPQGTIG